MQQNSGITPTKDSSRDMSTLNENSVSSGHHHNISSRLSHDSEPLTPLTIRNSFNSLFILYLKGLIHFFILIFCSKKTGAQYGYFIF